MGGCWSGQRSCKKTTIEECRCLDAGRLARQGILRRGSPRASLTWTNNQGEQTLAVTYYVESVASGAAVLHLHSRVSQDGSETAIGEPIPFVSTRPNFGGRAGGLFAR